MLLGSKIILTFSVFAIVGTAAWGDQTCLPRCFPAEPNTRSDCSSFEYIPTCRKSRFQPFIKEPECACLWKTFLGAIAPTQYFKKEGIGCLTWAVKTCVPGSNENDKKAKNNEEFLISELIRIAKGLKTKGEAPAKAPMNARKDIPQLLQELDQNARSLDKAGTSASKIISLKKGKTAGEFYGVLHKDGEASRTVEGLTYHKGDTKKDASSEIGPGFPKERWWLWYQRHEQFELGLFFLVIFFVAMFMLAAVLCLQFRAGRRKKPKKDTDSTEEDEDKEDKRQPGDLDLEIHKRFRTFGPGGPKYNIPIDDSTRPDGKKAKKPANLLKLLSKFVHVGHRSQKGVLEEFHDKRRMSSIPDYQSRPRLATPLKQNERKMSGVGSQTPIYEQVNYPSESEYEDILYERAPDPPVFSMNDTYEQPRPVPIYQNNPTLWDQSRYGGKSSELRDYENVDRSNLSPVPQVIETYEELNRKNSEVETISYNDTSQTPRTYPQPSPVSEESRTSPEASPPFSIQVELPSYVEKSRRVIPPTKAKKKTMQEGAVDSSMPSQTEKQNAVLPAIVWLIDAQRSTTDKSQREEERPKFRGGVPGPTNSKEAIIGLPKNAQRLNFVRDEIPDDKIDEHSNDIIAESSNRMKDVSPPNDFTNLNHDNVKYDSHHDVLQDPHYDVIDDSRNDVMGESSNDVIDEPIDEHSEDEAPSSEVPAWLQGYKTSRT